MPIDLILNARWVSTCSRPYSVYITLLVCLIKHSLFWKWKGEKWENVEKHTVTDYTPTEKSIDKKKKENIRNITCIMINMANSTARCILPKQN